MTRQIINVGAAPGDGTGDPLRAAFEKANANFAELFAAGWPVHPGYVAGRWYGQHRSAAGVTNTTATADTISFAPLFIYRPVTIDRVGVKTGGTNAVSGAANLAIYDTANSLPNAPVAEVGQAVAVPASANTNVIVTPPGGAFTLEPGPYWLALQTDTTMNMAGNNSESLNIAYHGTTNPAAWFAASSLICGYTAAAAYASGLPAMAAGLTPVTSALPGGVFRAA